MRFSTIILACVALSGCAHLQSIAPLPAPSPVTSVPIATACGPFVNGATLIAISSQIAANSATQIGTIAGYAATDSNGVSGLSATAFAGRIGDVIQFFNAEPIGSTIVHSAAQIAGTTFPSSPYAFPASLDAEVGSTIALATWSTGRIAAGSSQICYSQPLTLKAAGTYLFGDVDHYNDATLRSYIVVN